MLNRYNSNTKQLAKIASKLNSNNLLDLMSVTESLQKIIDDGITAPKSFNSNTKSNPTPTKFVSNKNKIEEFYTDIFEYSARYIYKYANEIVKHNSINGESTLKKLIIYDVLLDYGTEEPGPENFEIFIDGLHLPGIFNVKQSENNIEITLTDLWLIDDRVLPADVKVFGKIKELS